MFLPSKNRDVGSTADFLTADATDAADAADVLSKNYPEVTLNRVVW